MEWIIIYLVGFVANYYWLKHLALKYEGQGYIWKWRDVMFCVLYSFIWFIVSWVAPFALLKRKIKLFNLPPKPPKWL